MAGSEKPRSKWRRLIGVAGSVVSLAILTYIAVALISGKGLNLSGLKDVFSKHEPLEVADEYYFDVGRDRTFTNLGNSLAAAGTLGIQVLDAGGSETLRDPFRMTAPAVCGRGSRAIAFDIGGTSIRVFNETDVIASLETNGAVIAASINKNGWFCVCTQDSGGFKGAVEVYNDRSNAVYKVRMESGYVLSAELSPDNKNLAVLNLTDEGGRITLYNLSSDTPDHVFSLPGGLIIDIEYVTANDLLAVTADSLIKIDKNGSAGELYDFSGELLSGYSISGGSIALHLRDYGVGYSGMLVTLSEDGKLLGEITTQREIISMSAGGEYLAILGSDGLLFFDSGLGELLQVNDSGSAVGATQILMLGDDTVLAAGDHSAARIGIRK